MAATYEGASGDSAPTAVTDIESSRSGLVTDSAAIVITYFLTAAVGMVFWIAAARLIPADDLGFQTALISLLATVGTITAYGVGSAFKAMLSVPGCPRVARMTDGLVITLVVSLLVGVLGGIVAARTIGGGALTAIVVAVGSPIMAFFVLKDAALIGLHAARRLPVLNFVAVAAKVVLLWLLSALVGLAAVWATVLPAAAAALIAFTVLTPRLVKLTCNPAGPDPPDMRLTRRAMAEFALRDGIASSSSFGLILALPFVTTWLAGPVAGATLALALAVAQALDFFPDGMGAALTAHMAKDSAAIAVHIRRVWLGSAAIVIVGATVLAVSSPLVARIFGSEYRGMEFRTCLIVLAVGSVLRVPYSIWMSVLRAALETGTILRMNAAIFVVAVPAVVYCARTWGSVGAAAGLALGSLMMGGIGAWDLTRRWLKQPS